MNKPTVEDILAPKPTARPRIYAYTIADEDHAGLLKVGQTTRDVPFSYKPAYSLP